MRRKFGALTLLADSIIAGIVLIVFAAVPSPAPAQDAKLGKQVWLTKVSCRQCHGWSGNGLPDNPQAPGGANLRTTELAAEQIAEVIRCGRPGTPMPYFDRFAYTDDRCYGMTKSDLGDMTVTRGNKTLIKREVDALVAFIEANFIDKGPPTFEECRDMWGPEAMQCDRYPKAE